MPEMCDPSALPVPSDQNSATNISVNDSDPSAPPVPSDQNRATTISVNDYRTCPAILQHLVVDREQCCAILHGVLDRKHVTSWLAADCLDRAFAIIDAHWSFSDPASYFSDFQPPWNMRANASHWAYYTLHLLMVTLHDAKMLRTLHTATWCRLAMKISECFYFIEDIASAGKAQQLALQASRPEVLGMEGARCLAVAYFMEGTLAYEERQDYGGGEKLFRDSLHVLRHYGLHNSPEYADVQIQLAKAYLFADRQGPAQFLLNSSLKMKQMLMREFNSTPGSMYCNLLSQFGYARLQSPEDAEQHFRQAARCFDKAETDGYMTKVALASTIAQQGRLEESRNMLGDITRATVSEWPYSVYAMASLCLGDIALHMAFYDRQLFSPSEEFGVALQEYERSKNNASVINNPWLNLCIAYREPFTTLSHAEVKNQPKFGPLVNLCKCPHRM